MTIENTTVLTNFDIVGKVGLYAADVEVFNVSVSDGVLNIGFVHTAGAQQPVVNAIWVAQQ